MKLKKTLKTPPKTPDFAKNLLTWFKKYGRKTLPWQHNKTPYRVWLSEIMLQQTQVATVIPYFERFLTVFPDIISLANAKEDEVLHLWTGLGYYSRARNLHKAAKIIVQDYQGIFPDTLDTLKNLPGIGRSTAGAILSIAFKKPIAILDGNVKRVLTRFAGITSSIDEKNTEQKLWQLAEQYTSQKSPDLYAQAIMDLGATICLRSKPLCEQCPFQKTCRARQLNIENLLPKKNPKKSLPRKQTTFLFLKYKNFLLLKKRPAKGIWGGLWCPLEIKEHVNVAAIKNFLKKEYAVVAKNIQIEKMFPHTFTHFHLDILPAVITLSSKKYFEKAMSTMWFNLQKSQAVGLPQPVKKIFEKLNF